MRSDTYEAMAKHEDSHWWYVARREILATVIKTFNLPENAQILEAGAGTGGNTKMLKQFGQVTVLEPNENAQKYLQEKTGLPVIVCSLPDITPLAEKKFDLIVLFDVLEHIENDVEALESLKKLLTPEGKIFITVPAFPFLWGEHDKVHYHFRRYVKPTLNQVCSQANMNIIQMGYFNTFLFPVIAAIRLLQKTLGKGGTDQDKIPSPFVNKILCIIFSAEKAFVKRGGFPFGVSLFSVIKPNSTNTE